MSVVSGRPLPTRPNRIRHRHTSVTARTQNKHEVLLYTAPNAPLILICFFYTRPEFKIFKLHIVISATFPKRADKTETGPSIDDVFRRNTIRWDNVYMRRLLFPNFQMGPYILWLMVTIKLYGFFGCSDVVLPVYARHILRVLVSRPFGARLTRIRKRIGQSRGKNVVPFSRSVKLGSTRCNALGRTCLSIITYSDNKK